MIRGFRSTLRGLLRDRWWRISSPLARGEMVERLLEFPSERQRINNAVNPEMVVASEATGSDVVGRHQTNDGAGHTVHAAFKQLVVAACAEFPSGHLVLTRSGHSADFVSDFSKLSASCAAAKFVAFAQRP